MITVTGGLLTGEALEYLPDEVTEVQLDVPHGGRLLVVLALEVQPGTVDVLDKCGVETLSLAI